MWISSLCPPKLKCIVYSEIRIAQVSEHIASCHDPDKFVSVIDDGRKVTFHYIHDDLRHADRITVEGLEVFANHGVYPEENALGQKFIVSLVLYADLRAAGEHDNLDASIDYGSVCHDVDGYLREHTFKLIEAAAEGTAQMLLRRYPSLLGVRIKLDKPWAPVGLPLASCGVEIERVR